MQLSALDQEDPLEEGMITHSSVLNLEIPMDRGAWWAIVHWVAKNQAQNDLARMHACLYVS